MNFDTLYASPTGRTSRSYFVPALITVVLAIAFFAYFVTGRTAHFCMLVLMYPLFVLLARRLQDIGHSAWLLLAPLALVLLCFASVLGYITLSSSIAGILPWTATAVAAAFALWGGVSSGK